MRRQQRMISRAWFLASILAVACAIDACVDNRHEQIFVLLYITTLPDHTNSVAVLDPSDSACSEPAFVDTTVPFQSL